MKKPDGNTIKHIALSLGLSASTISRALNDHPYIHEDTKKKVREEAKKIGYRHNALAANLRNKKSNTIGLIIPRISMYFQSAVITAIQNKLHDEGYNLIICQSNESVKMEKELVNTLYASRVEGLIVSATLNTTDFSPFDIFSESDIPLLFYDRVPKNYPAHIIEGDDFTGINEATSYLIEQGCKRIAYISGPLTCNLYKNRYAGYLYALKKYEINPDYNLVFFHELTKENTMITCEKIFAEAPYPDAVLACNDTSAITVIQHAKKLNINIPEKIKVIGYSNDPRTEIISPSITSVEQFPHDVGWKAATLMMDLIQKKVKPGENYISITTPIQLIKRESSMP